MEAQYAQLQNDSIHWIQEQQRVQAQIEELDAARNVEKQRADNLQAQLDELLVTTAPAEMPAEVTVDLSPAADNLPLLKRVPASSFGIEFPTDPEKGDLYLRTDYLPSKLFKYNGDRWIEADKARTDSYAFNEQYIEFLITKLKTGEYTTEDINDVEQEQIAQYLQDKNGKPI